MFLYLKYFVSIVFTYLKICTCNSFRLDIKCLNSLQQIKPRKLISNCENDVIINNRQYVRFFFEKKILEIIPIHTFFIPIITKKDKKFCVNGRFLDETSNLSYSYFYKYNNNNYNLVLTFEVDKSKKFVNIKCKLYQE